MIDHRWKACLEAFACGLTIWILVAPTLLRSLIVNRRAFWNVLHRQVALYKCHLVLQECRWIVFKLWFHFFWRLWIYHTALYLLASVCRPQVWKYLIKSYSTKRFCKCRCICMAAQSHLQAVLPLPLWNWSTEKSCCTHRSMLTTLSYARVLALWSRFGECLFSHCECLFSYGGNSYIGRLKAVCHFEYLDCMTQMQKRLYACLTWSSKIWPRSRTFATWKFEGSKMFKGIIDSEESNRTVPEFECRPRSCKAAAPFWSIMVEVL